MVVLTTTWGLAGIRCARGETAWESAELVVRS